MKEVAAATKLMKLHVRESLNFADGFFTNDKKHQLEVVKIIRHYQPAVVFANAIHDRHPDHARSAELVRDACFLAGLSKINTTYKGVKQKAFRPKAVYHYIQALHVEPDFVVDVSDYYDRKTEVIKAFKSQFFNPNSKEPNTFISSPQFMEFVRARAIHFGVPSGMQYAEGFTANRTLGVEDVTKLL